MERLVEINWLIKKVMVYKKSGDDVMFNEIVSCLESKIKYYLKKLNYSNIGDKDDIKQEIIIKIYKVLNIFNIRDIDISYDVFVCELNEVKKCNSVFRNNEYLYNFYNEYKDIISDNFDYNNLYYEFKLFCNENQLKKYIDISIENLIKDLFRKSKKELVYGENIESNCDDYKISKEIDLSKINMSEKDYNFIKLFYRNNRRLTETEVGNVLGVTQQAVNKRRNRIQRKYNIHI